jgi:hypothetical protein
MLIGENMNIEKTHGSKGLAPKPVTKSLTKKASVQFQDTLNKALRSAKSRASQPTTTPAIESEKKEMIQNRLRSGFYDRPENLEVIADKLLSKGKPHD